MTLYRIVYSQEAFQDLDIIYRFIVTESLDLKIAERFVKKMKNAIKSLKEFPFRHQKCEIAFRGTKDVRQFSTSNYLIIYVIDEASKTVAIIGIISCKQDKNKVIN